LNRERNSLILQPNTEAPNYPPMNQLVQRKGFDLRVFRFTDSKLFYTQGRYGNSNEIDIPFENIDGEQVSFQTSRIGLSLFGSFLIAAGILSILLINAAKPLGLWIPIVFFVSGILCWGGYFYSRSSFWKLKLKSEDFIYFYKNIPSREETDRFLHDMIEARNTYLRENYLHIDENLDYEQQYYNLRWMQSINAISKAEFELKYEELKQTVTPEKKIIGFTR
jgi:hypothetical protein